MMRDDLVQTLEAALKGLQYPSESDEPFEVHLGKVCTNTEQHVRELLGVSTDLGCEVWTVERFFQELIPDEEFKRLQKLIMLELSDLKVYRFGSVNVVVAIAGIAKDGRLVALKTLSIET